MHESFLRFLRVGVCSILLVSITSQSDKFLVPEWKPRQFVPGSRVTDTYNTCILCSTLTILTGIMSHQY